MLSPARAGTPGRRASRSTPARQQQQQQHQQHQQQQQQQLLQQSPVQKTNLQRELARARIATPLLKEKLRDRPHQLGALNRKLASARNPPGAAAAGSQTSTAAQPRLDGGAEAGAQVEPPLLHAALPLDLQLKTGAQFLSHHSVAWALPACSDAMAALPDGAGGDDYEARGSADSCAPQLLSDAAARDALCAELSQASRVFAYPAQWWTAPLLLATAGVAEQLHSRIVAEVVADWRAGLGAAHANRRAQAPPSGAVPSAAVAGVAAKAKALPGAARASQSRGKRPREGGEGEGGAGEGSSGGALVASAAGSTARGSGGQAAATAGSAAPTGHGSSSSSSCSRLPKPRAQPGAAGDRPPPSKPKSSSSRSGSGGTRKEAGNASYSTAAAALSSSAIAARIINRVSAQRSAESGPGASGAGDASPRLTGEPAVVLGGAAGGSTPRCQGNGAAPASSSSSSDTVLLEIQRRAATSVASAAARAAPSEPPSSSPEGAALLQTQLGAEAARQLREAAMLAGSSWWSGSPDGEAPDLGGEGGDGVGGQEAEREPSDGSVLRRAERAVVAFSSHFTAAGASSSHSTVMASSSHSTVMASSSHSTAAEAATSTAAAGLLFSPGPPGAPGKRRRWVAAGVKFGEAEAAAATVWEFSSESALTGSAAATTGWSSRSALRAISSSATAGVEGGFPAQRRSALAAGPRAGADSALLCPSLPVWWPGSGGSLPLGDVELSAAPARGARAGGAAAGGAGEQAKGGAAAPPASSAAAAVAASASAAVPRAVLALRPDTSAGVLEWSARVRRCQRAVVSCWHALLQRPPQQRGGAPFFMLRFPPDDSRGNVLLVARLSWVATGGALPNARGAAASSRSSSAAAEERDPISAEERDPIIAILARSSRNLRSLLAAQGVPFATPLDPHLQPPLPLPGLSLLPSDGRAPTMLYGGVDGDASAAAAPTSKRVGFASVEGEAAAMQSEDEVFGLAAPSAPAPNPPSLARAPASSADGRRDSLRGSEHSVGSLLLFGGTFAARDLLAALLTSISPTLPTPMERAAASSRLGAQHAPGASSLLPPPALLRIPYASFALPGAGGDALLRAISSNSGRPGGSLLDVPQVLSLQPFLHAQEERLGISVRMQRPVRPPSDAPASAGARQRAQGVERQLTAPPAPLLPHVLALSGPLLPGVARRIAQIVGRGCSAAPYPSAAAVAAAAEEDGVEEAPGSASGAAKPASRSIYTAQLEGHSAAASFSDPLLLSALQRLWGDTAARQAALQPQRGGLSVASSSSAAAVPAPTNVIAPLVRFACYSQREAEAAAPSPSSSSAAAPAESAAGASAGLRYAYAQL